MTTCERLVSLGKLNPNEPNKLLAQSYYELLENKQPILGKFLIFIMCSFNLLLIYILKFVNLG